MRTPLLGLTVPLLLLAAALTGAAPLAAAQGETYAISGRVLSDTGEPLVGARVGGYTYHDSPTRSSSGSNDEAVTDEEGRYTLNLAAGRGWINVYYEEWRRSDGRDIEVTGARDDVDFTLVTPPPKTARIEGRVVGADGSPIEGAEVYLQQACCMAYPMPIDAGVASDGGGSAGSPGETTTAPAEAEPASTTSSEPEKRIAPMPYYEDHASARTDRDGRFAFDAYAGPRQIVAHAMGYAQTTVEVEAKDNETTTVEVRLEKVPARDAVLTGRVVDAATGAPIANAHVSARSLEWGRYASATTDADGRYRIQTLPGWTEIGVSFWGGYPIAIAEETATDAISMPRPLEQQYYPANMLVKLASGETTETIELEPKPKPTIVLLGYVVDPDAKTGVPGAHVNVWNHETNDWGEAKTDATGSFRILVRPGHYTVSAWKEGHLGGAQTLTVSTDPTQRHDVLLPKGEARWAPCYDENDCGGGVLYADVKRDGAEGGSTPPMAAPMPAAPQRTAGVSEDASTAAGDEQRAATFSGSGGGLPPYDPGQTGTVPAAAEESPVAEVPAAGALLALAALAGVALIGARRRG